MVITKMTLGDNEFYLDQILEQSVHVYAPLAKVSGAELLIVSSHDLPAVCRGDALLVSKLLTELLARATFIRDGEVRLDAFVVRGGAKTGHEDGQCVRLGLAVTSIPPADLAKSPISLNQDQDRLRGLSGEGEMCLGTCRELAGKLGGGVQIANAPGPGRGIRADIVLGVSANPCPVLPSPPLLEPGLRALVIDDNVAVRAVMTDLLQRLGLEAFSAALVEAAADAIQVEAGRFDVVFVDAELACDEFRQAMLTGRHGLAPDTPVVVMDYADDSGGVDVAGAQNVDRTTLFKPVTRHALNKALGSVFERRATPARPAPGVAPGTLDADILAGIRALVVDDNPFNLEVVEPILVMFGIQVATAQSGPEALAILDRGQDFDVVLMDMQMPGMDGCETTRRIRASKGFGNLPILALTANDDPLAREKCLACGMNDFLTKPLDTPALIRALTRWCPQGTGGGYNWSK